jgi:hypothetical protein
VSVHVNPKEEPNHDLKITFGGFIQNGPEDQLLNGVCGTEATRNVLNCDVHNGLVDWNIREVTFQVIPTGDSEQHYYRERTSIAPLQTERVSIRLGMQLPRDEYIKFLGQPGGQSLSHWSWLIVGTKGKRRVSPPDLRQRQSPAMSIRPRSVLHRKPSTTSGSSRITA